MNATFLGHWALIVGIVLAVIAGFTAIPSLPIVLFILGLVVGLLNIKEKEGTPFLVAVIALLLIGVAGSQVGGETVASILNNFIAFMAAAGLIVALKQVLSVVKPTS
jgi:uncharacterized membrane protein YccC